MKIHTEKSEKLWNTAEKWLWWEESIGFSHSQTHLRLKELPPWHILLDWTGRCLSLAFSAILPVLQQLHTNFQRKSTNFTFILCTQWSKIKLSILQQQGIRPISIVEPFHTLPTDACLGTVLLPSKALRPFLTVLEIYVKNASTLTNAVCPMPSSTNSNISLMHFLAVDILIILSSTICAFPCREACIR